MVKKVVKPTPIPEIGSIDNAIGRQPSHMLALEKRIMLDAAGAATGAESAEKANDASATENTDAAGANGDPETPQADNSQFVDSKPPAQAKSRPIDPSGNYELALGSEQDSNEVVFIDSAVPDLQNLLNSIAGGSQIFILDSDSDGVKQMSRIMQDLMGENNNNPIDAVHIISHGDQGQLQLGNSFLTFESMNGEHANDLSIIGKALSENADILIYGCNFGEGEAGKDALDLLSELTDADIAASNDTTGHNSYDGNWTLEVAVGEINADAMIVAANWDAPTQVVNLDAQFNAEDVMVGNNQNLNEDASDELTVVSPLTDNSNEKRQLTENQEDSDELERNNEIEEDDAQEDDVDEKEQNELKPEAQSNIINHYTGEKSNNEQSSNQARSDISLKTIGVTSMLAAAESKGLKIKKADEEDGVIGDYVWIDSDEDGKQDSNEEGKNGVTVKLYKDDGDGNHEPGTDDELIGTTVTQAKGLDDGFYEFTGLAKGDYFVYIESPSGYSFTQRTENDPNRNGNDSDVNNSGQLLGYTDIFKLKDKSETNIDAGLLKNGPSLSGFVWSDSNRDGIQDAGEDGVVSVKVELYEDADGDGLIEPNGDDGAAVETTNTNANGEYIFADLDDDGDYYVHIIKPGANDDQAFTLKNQGVDDALDSDVNTFGYSEMVSLSGGSASLDAGLVTITGNQCIDAENNLIPDNEIFIPLSDGKIDSDYNASGELNASQPDGDGDVGIDGDETPSLSSGQTSSGFVHFQYDVTDNNPFIIDPTTAEMVFNVEDFDFKVDQNSGYDFSEEMTLQIENNAGDLIGNAITIDFSNYGLYRADGFGETNNADVDYKISLVNDFGLSTAELNTLYANGNFMNGIDFDVDVILKGVVSATSNIGSVGNTSEFIDMNFCSGHGVGVGDYVWHDSNGNGKQGANELGVNDVTVNLYLDDGDGVHEPGAGDVLVATTVTINNPLSVSPSGDGFYSFINLAPGDYFVEFELPNGWLFTEKDSNGTNDTNDSDVNTMPAELVGLTDIFTLASGEYNPDIDAGLIIVELDASIGDFVWNDLNADGIQDAGEAGIDGVTVNLLDSGGTQIATTTTAGGGLYAFNNLTPDDYTVEFVLAGSGYDAFSPQNQGGDDAKDSDADGTTGKTGVITLISGQSDTTNDAGLYQFASIGDFVWDDLNADGIQDAGEVGIDGVIVNLLDSGGTQIATTTTAGGGSYAFNNLTPDDYTVEFVLAGSGYDAFSPQNQGGDDAKDSDADGTSGKTGVITLISGQSDTTNDAGLYQFASIGDFVWDDLNADGIQDAGEAGIDGVTVNLLDSGGTQIATTTTAGGGSYAFNNLTPDDYTVEFVLAGSGYDAFSPQNQGGDDAKDSDADGTSGKTGVITLISGQSDTTNDAGLYQFASIGDFVWDDLTTSRRVYLG